MSEPSAKKKSKKRLKLESSISLGINDAGETVVFKKKKKKKSCSVSARPSTHNLPSSIPTSPFAQVLSSSIDFFTCSPFS